MAKYIDADLLIDKLEELQFNAPVMTPVMKIYNVIELVEDQPTADVVEVKHGKWRFIMETQNKRVLGCSVCNYVRRLSFGEPFPELCEKCGTKMDGGNAE